MLTAPLIFEWSGEAMVPLKRYAKLCDEEFVVHELYRLEPIAERSAKSHAHFFARLHDIWLSLPEGVDQRFIVEDHFRRHLLIKAGYYNMRTYVAGNRAELQRALEWGRSGDYAIVTVDGLVATEYTAKSMARSAMAGKEFQAAKTKVLELAEAMIGVGREQAA